MKNWKTYKKNLLKDLYFKKEYETLGPEYELVKSVVARRIDQGLTQKQLAEKIKTKQSSISRLENASVMPSLSFVQKIADALGARLIVRLEEK